MGKSKLTLKIDEEVKELAKEKYNISKTVENHLQDLISGPDTIEERIDQIDEEIKNHKDEISQHQLEISNLQSEKNVLEKQLNQEAKADSERHRFFKIAKRNIGKSWNKPDDIPAYWRNKFDESIDELWELAKDSDAKPAEVKSDSQSSRTSVTTV